MGLIKQHTYGSGKLHFAQFLPNTQTPGALRYIGNTTELTLTSEQEKLDHYDSDNGIRTKDDSVVTSLEQSGTFVTDNINDENVAMFFLGTTTSLSQASGTAQEDTIASVEFGSYQLGITPTRPTGVRKVTVTSVALSAAPATAYTAGLDYVVDADRGLVTILPGGAITKGAGIKITYSFAASTRQQVMSSNKTVEGRLWFESKNAVGPQRDYTFPYVKLTPNGDFALKSDDWLTMPFSVEVLTLGALAAVYADGVAMAS